MAFRCLIFAGIVAGIPGAIGQALESARQGDLNPLMLVLVLLIAVAVVYFVVFIERGQRRLTVNYAQRQGRQAYNAQTSHLPLKLIWRVLYQQFSPVACCYFQPL